MSLTGTCEVMVSASGISIQAQMTRVASQGIEPVDTDLPPGTAGTLSSRLADTLGIVTPSANHGVLAGRRVDLYWADGMRHGMVGFSDDYVLQGDVTFLNAITELGFAARVNTANQTGYVLSLDPTNSYFNLIKLDPEQPGGFEDLVNNHVSDLVFTPEVNYHITFTVEGASLRGELRSSDGTILNTIEYTDPDYTTGDVAAWAWRSDDSGSISGRWANVSLGEIAFPAVTAYPQMPETFLQSEDGRGLEISDPSGQFPLVAAVGPLGITAGQVRIHEGDGADLPPEGTAIVMAPQVDLDVTFDGDNLVLIAAATTQRSHLTFVDAGGATLQAIEFGPGEAWMWVANTGTTNPLSGNAVATVRASNGNSESPSNVKLTGLQYAV